MWVSASGPASLALLWWGRRVGGLGPGLTSESADAARAVLRNDLSAGPRFCGTHRRCRSDLPGLGKRPGFSGSGGQRVRAIPQPRKGMTLTIVETRAVTGGVDTHADVHVAAALDPIGGLLGVAQFPASAAGYAAGVRVVEVDHSDRQDRRRQGKSDPLDAPRSSTPSSSASTNSSSRWSPPTLPACSPCT